MPTLNQDPIAKVADPTVAEALQAILESVKALDAKVTSAFPGGDADGHRRGHEALIQMAESKRKLAEAVKEKTISALVWAAIVAIASAVWHQISPK